MTPSPEAASGPTIRLIGRPDFDVSAFLDYLASEHLEWARTQGATSAEELTEVAGRLCYMSFGPRQSPRKNRDYILNLVAQGHESVLEHIGWTFLLTGVSRSFSHQFVRHRVGFAFSQLSQQYADQRGMLVLMPELVKSSKPLAEVWERAVAEARTAYERILRELESSLPDTPGTGSARWEQRRAIRSAARSVLPEAMETRIVFTANARAIRHFLEVRGGVPGDLEMRLVASELLSLVNKEAPSVFADFETIEHEGWPLVRRTRQGGPE